MKKIITIVLVALAALVFAPKAQADDCGHYETRYRIEQVYVPPQLIGYTSQGYPIYSEGYYVSRYVPYTVWISRPCYPRRYYAPRLYYPRIHIRIGL